MAIVACKGWFAYSTWNCLLLCHIHTSVPCNSWRELFPWTSPLHSSLWNLAVETGCSSHRHSIHSYQIGELWNPTSIPRDNIARWGYIMCFINSRMRLVLALVRQAEAPGSTRNAQSHWVACILFFDVIIQRSQILPIKPAVLSGILLNLLILDQDEILFCEHNILLPCLPHVDLPPHT